MILIPCIPLALIFLQSGLEEDWRGPIFLHHNVHNANAGYSHVIVILLCDTLQEQYQQGYRILYSQTLVISTILQRIRNCRPRTDFT